MTITPTSPTVQVDELSQNECQLLLGLAAVGRVAFIQDGLPMVLPVNYRLVSDELGLWIVFRTRVGNVIDRAPEKVAFEIDGIDHEQHQGWSVLVRGVLHHFDGNEVELFSQHFDPKPWPQDERSSWMAIKPHSVSGRRLCSANGDEAFPAEGYL